MKKWRPSNFSQRSRNNERLKSLYPGIGDTQFRHFPLLEKQSEGSKLSPYPEGVPESDKEDINFTTQICEEEFSDTNSVQYCYGTLSNLVMKLFTPIQKGLMQNHLESKQRKSCKMGLIISVLHGRALVEYNVYSSVFILIH